MAVLVDTTVNTWSMACSDILLVKIPLFPSARVTDGFRVRVPQHACACADHPRFEQPVVRLLEKSRHARV